MYSFRYNASSAELGLEAPNSRPKFKLLLFKSSERLMATFDSLI